jgi:hypothetical protein
VSLEITTLKLYINAIGQFSNNLNQSTGSRINHLVCISRPSSLLLKRIHQRIYSLPSQRAASPLKAVAPVTTKALLKLGFLYLKTFLLFPY